MINKLFIRDYQSIALADLKLGPLTVIVGNNRNGKSATLRALRALFFNETGADFITRGKPLCEVSVYLDDGPIITWTKKRAGGAEYVLTQNSDGTTRNFTKLGSSVPPEIEAALNIRSIKVSDTVTLTPQVHPQEDYAFLLDLPAGQAAKALAKFTRLDVVVEAQGAIRTDVRRSKLDVVTEARHIEDAEARLISYQDLGIVDVELKQVEALLDEAEDLETEIEEARVKWLRYVDAERMSRISIVDSPTLLKTEFECQQLAHRMGVFEMYKVASRNQVTALTTLEKHDVLTADDQSAWDALELCPTCGQPVQG